MNWRGVDALALQDGIHPWRRVAWLAVPGLNILHVYLEHEYPEPVFGRLSGKQHDISGAPLHIVPVPRLPERILRNFGLYELGPDFHKYRRLWPKRALPRDDPWQRWADDMAFLSFLQLEDMVPDAPQMAALEPPSELPSGENSRIGITAHLYYLDLWPEIRDAICRMPRGARIVLSIAQDAVPSGEGTKEGVTAEARARWPDARIRVTPNSGRDIGPFMQLLADGEFDGLDCVCKIHGKKTIRGGEATYFGEAWRRYSIGDLLPGSGQIAAVARRFAENPKLGVLGPERLHMPSKRVPGLEQFNYDGHDALDDLMAARFGRDVRADIDFFAGAMFWFRPAAFALLREVPSGGWTFPAEPTEKYHLAHALERLLPTSAKLAGYTVEDV